MACKFSLFRSDIILTCKTISCRPDFTPHQTDTTHSPWAYVDGAIPAMQTPYIGTHRDYLAQHGAQHRHELPPFIGENLDPTNLFYPAVMQDFKQDIMFDIDDSDEDAEQMQCYQRLKSLYAIIFYDNDVAHNDLLEEDLK